MQRSVIVSLVFSTLFIVCHGKDVSAQQDTSVIAQTRKYVRYIDSIDQLEYTPGSGFSKGIADGIISIDGKAVGGTGTYTLYNERFDSVFRIEYHWNYPLNIYQVYYFRDHELIYGTLRLVTADSQQRKLYFREEFYNCGKLIYRYPLEDPTTRYIDLSHLSLYDEGQKLLKDFLKGKQ